MTLRLAAERLVKQWRDEKDQKHHGHVDYWHGVHDALFDCAQQLEQVLSEALQGHEAGAVHKGEM